MSRPSNSGEHWACQHTLDNAVMERVPRNDRTMNISLIAKISAIKRRCPDTHDSLGWTLHAESIGRVTTGAAALDYWNPTRAPKMPTGLWTR